MQEVCDPKAKVLVVDDAPENVEILQEILCDDYVVSTAMNGEEALETAAQFRPDLILLDIMMPGIDGYEVCRRLRQAGGQRQAKIIMVSAKALVGERIEGYDAGADDYIVKPFDEDELLSKVRVYLKLKKHEEVDQLKNELISVLASQTRTPFAGIMAAAKSVMVEKEMTEGSRSNHAALIMERLEALREFLETSIKLISIHAGVVKLKLGRHQLAPLLEKAAGMTTCPDGAAEFELESYSGNAIELLVDEPRFVDALSTLIETSTADSAATKVGASCQGEKIIIRINGPSNEQPTEELGAALESFKVLLHSVDLYEASAEICSTLRVAVANEVIRSHNGRLFASHEGQRVTGFCLELPCSA